MLSSKKEHLHESSLENDQLFHSFVLGTRWMLAMSVLTLPISYLISLLLGRMAPKALGLYTLLIISSSITMALMFGGSQTLVRFLPSIPASYRIPFVLTYGFLVFGTTVPLLIVIGIKPSLLSLLVRRPLDPGTVRYLLPFVPLVLLANFSRAILQARMEIKWMAIAGKLVPIVSLAGFVGVFLFQGHVPDDRLGETILIVFCTAQLLSLLLAAYHVYTRFIKVEPFHLALFLPPGFWSFGLTITLSVIVVIILDNFDQAVVFSRFEISQLGIYRAALSTAEFVRWAPILLIRSIMPLFSHLLADGQHPQLRLLYHRTIKYNTLAASTIALTIILFSREIMGLFGSTYMQAESILVLLASSFVLSGISTVNSSFLVAKGRAELGLVSGIVGSVLQIAFSLILIRPLGIIGVVIGKIINLGCITVLEVWFVNRIAGLRPDRDTSGILGVLFLASMLSRYLQPESMAFVMIRNVILLTTFVALALRWLNQDDHYHLYSFGRGRFE